MPRSGVWLGVTGAVLIWVGVAVAARATNPPAAAFSGTYKVTIRTTNAKLATTHWIYAPRRRCAGPCYAVTFRQRLVSEKSWRSSLLAFRWKGTAYAFSRKLPKFADCRGRSGQGSAVKKGYDVTSSLKFVVHAITNGRVTRLSGTGKDSYVPNAIGRKHHCVAGAYLYKLSGVAR
jgi:hypothetical protein